MQALGRRAIVVGAGIGGLAAAQALSRHFHEVLVLERDALPTDAAARPGVPQGRQPHGLLSGGLRALEAMLPGFGDDLAAAGAVRLVAGLDVVQEFAGQSWPQRQDFGFYNYSLTRGLFEAVLRRRVDANENVVFLGSCRVSEILGAPDGDRVTGVRCQGCDLPAEIEADVVVDATGRGALTRAFLDAQGFLPPEETVIGVDIGYATIAFALSEANAPDFKHLLTFPAVPDDPNGGLMVRVEGDTWLATMGCIGRDGLPEDLESFMQVARQLHSGTIHDALVGATPLSSVMRFRFSESVWRHFGDLERFPAGLLPIGDAICRLNPLYGQGMSVAVLQAKLLSSLFDDREAIEEAFGSLSDAYLRGTEAIIATPWALTAVPDLALPQTRGERPADLAAEMAYRQALNRLSTRHPDVRKLMLEVQHFLKPASLLRAPDLERRVFREIAASDAGGVPRAVSAARR